MNDVITQPLGEAVEDQAVAARSRGNKHADLAAAFVADFPVGTTLTVEAFDKWAMDNGHYDAVDTNSNADLVYSRNLLRGRVNNGALSHQRFAESAASEDVLCFKVVVADWGKTYTVSPTEIEVERETKRLPDRVRTLMRTKRRQLLILTDSTDFDKLDPETRLRVEFLQDELEDFEARLQKDVMLYQRRFKGIQKRVAAAHLLNSNGGVKAMLEDHSED